jgi:hypothetical protein
VVGWEEVPDLSTLKTRANLYKALETTYPEEKRKTLSNWESQLWPFAHTMGESDLVVMPLKNRAAIVAFGFLLTRNDESTGHTHVLLREAVGIFVGIKIYCLKLSK